MNQTTALLFFGIPIVCIIVIGVSQFGDEMFKKKFILERRNRSAGDGKRGQNRRYDDPKASGGASDSSAESV